MLNERHTITLSHVLYAAAAMALQDLALNLCWSVGIIQLTKRNVAMLKL